MHTHLSSHALLPLHLCFPSTSASSPHPLTCVGRDGGSTTRVDASTSRQEVTGGGSCGLPEETGERERDKREERRERGREKREERESEREREASELRSSHERLCDARAAV